MAFLEMYIFLLCARKVSSTWLPQVKAPTPSMSELSDTSLAVPIWESEESSSYRAQCFSSPTHFVELAVEMVVVG